MNIAAVGSGTAAAWKLKSTDPPPAPEGLPEVIQLPMVQVTVGPPADRKYDPELLLDEKELRGADCPPGGTSMLFELAKLMRNWLRLSVIVWPLTPDGSEAGTGGRKPKADVPEVSVEDGPMMNWLVVPNPDGKSSASQVTVPIQESEVFTDSVKTTFAMAEETITKNTTTAVICDFKLFIT